MSNRHQQHYDDVWVSIQEHIAEKIDELVEEGVSYEEAVRQAHASFGDMRVVAENSRDVWDGPLESVGHDLAAAILRILRSARWTLPIILSMALGLGACTAIFTLIHAILLKSLPVENPQALYRLGDQGDQDGSDRIAFQNDDGDFYLFSYSLYLHLRSAIPEFSSLSAVEAGSDVFSVRYENSTPTAVSGEYVSGNYFQTFGVRPFLGRNLTDADDMAGALPAVVMSYRGWQHDYAANPGIVGSELVLQGQTVRVVGVAAPEFFGDRVTPNPPVFWIPLALEPILRRDYPSLPHPEENWLYIVGRVRIGVNVNDLQDKISSTLRQWLWTQSTYTTLPNSSAISNQHVILTRANSGIQEFQVESQGELELLLVFATIVLFISCISSANLLLKAGSVQRDETMRRIALGASRSRVIQKSVIESVVLGIAGGIAGLWVSYMVAHAVLSLAFPNAPYSEIHATPSIPTAGFALCISMVAGVIIGIVPAWITSRVKRPRVRLYERAFTAAQVALAGVLVVAASMAWAKIWRLEHQNVGVALNDRYVVRLAINGAGYRPEQFTRLYQTLQDGLARIPGAQRVGLSLAAPLDGYESNLFYPKVHFPAGSSAANVKRPWALLNRVGPGFFQTVGERLRQGREFRADDDETSPPVAIVNEAFARKFFAGENPLGKKFGDLGQGRVPLYTIVGVVSDARYITAKDETPPIYFRPLLQQHQNLTDPVEREMEVASAFPGSAVVQASGEPEKIEESIRAAIYRIDPHLAIIGVHTFNDQIRSSFRQERMLASIISLFATMGLVLLILGIATTNTAENHSQPTKDEEQVTAAMVLSQIQ